MGEMTLIAEGLQFPEGPIWLKDGRVLVVEIKSGTLAAVSPDGTVERVATTGGGPNGAAVGPDGKVYVCNNGGFEWYELEGIVAPGPQPADYIGGRIQRVDIDTGQVEDVYTECGGNPLRGPNDIVFDDQGGFYFTDLGKSRARDQDKAGVYYATTDGSSVTELVYGLDHANGIALSPDGSRVYAAETITGRVWAWDIDSPGVFEPRTGVRPREPAVQLRRLPAARLDGRRQRRQRLRRHARHRRVSVISPDGKLLDQYMVPQAGHVRHQRVLRRRRLPHGVHHVVGPRPALQDGVAAPGLPLNYEI